MLKAKACTYGLVLITITVLVPIVVFICLWLWPWVNRFNACCFFAGFGINFGLQRYFYAKPLRRYQNEKINIRPQKPNVKMRKKQFKTKTATGEKVEENSRPVVSQEAPLEK